MVYSISLRLLTLAILWTGLGILKIEEMLGTQFVWQAAVFSILVIGGTILEFLLGYDGDHNLLPVVQTILAIGLVFLIRIKPTMAEDQFVWANIGLVLFYVVLFGIRDYKKMGEYQYIWGLGALVLLFITLIFGVPINGSTRWEKFGK